MNGKLMKNLWTGEINDNMMFFELYCTQANLHMQI